MKIRACKNQCRIVGSEGFWSEDFLKFGLCVSRFLWNCRVTPKTEPVSPGRAYTTLVVPVFFNFLALEKPTYIIITTLPTTPSVSKVSCGWVVGGQRNIKVILWFKP